MSQSTSASIPESRSSLRIKLLLLTGSLLFALFCAEGVVRILFNSKLKQQRNSRYAYEADSIGGYDITPNRPPWTVSVNGEYKYQWFSNEIGCMDRSYEDESKYILLVGDSFTHSWGRFDYLWGTQMEVLLGVRIVKAGVTGYGNRQQLLKAKKVIEKIGIAPQMIIVGYYTNDLLDDWIFPNRTVIDGFLVDQTSTHNYNTLERTTKSTQELKSQLLKRQTQNNPWSLSRSFFWELLCTKLNSPSPPPLSIDLYFLLEDETPQRQEAWRQHRNNLKTFHSYANELGSELLIVMIPNKIQVYPALLKNIVVDPQLDLHRANNRLAAFFKNEKINSFDLMKPFQTYARFEENGTPLNKSDLYWKIDGHWNQRGHTLGALLTAEYIMNNFTHLKLLAPDCKTIIQTKLTDLSPTHSK